MMKINWGNVVSLFGTPLVTWIGLLIWKSMTFKVAPYLSGQHNRKVLPSKIEEETLIPNFLLKLILLDLKAKNVVEDDSDGYWSVKKHGWGRTL